MNARGDLGVITVSVQTHFHFGELRTTDEAVGVPLGTIIDDIFEQDPDVEVTLKRVPGGANMLKFCSKIHGRRQATAAAVQRLLGASRFVAAGTARVRNFGRDEKALRVDAMRQFNKARAESVGYYRGARVEFPEWAVSHCCGYCLFCM